METIILCGFYCAGKTAIGTQIAEIHNIPFFDTDQLLEKKYQKKVRDLFRSLGESAFRDLEEEMISSLEKKPQILALGGGTLLRENNQRIIKQLGKVVYLKASIETLLQRTEKRGFPAFFKNREELEKLADSRFPLYERASDYILETDGLSEEEVVLKICEWLWETILLEKYSASPHGESLMEKPSGSL